jgi:polar amino acid transport system substrate-binding protein
MNTKEHCVMKMFNFKYLQIVIILIINIVFHCLLVDHNVLAADNKKIVLATDVWEPYYGPDLINKGFFTEITKESFKRVGYNCVVCFVPWKRALELGKSGKYDGLLGAFYSIERTEFFEFSMPICEEQLVFFSKKNTIKKKYSSLHDLKGYIIGTVRGYHYTDEFHNANYLTKDVATKTVDNISRLLLGRLDLVLASKLVFLHILRNDYPEIMNTLTRLEPPLVTSKLHITISKQNQNYKQIIQDFNKGLKMIKEDNTFDNILKKHGLN